MLSSYCLYLPLKTEVNEDKLFHNSNKIPNLSITYRKNQGENLCQCEIKTKRHDMLTTIFIFWLQIGVNGHLTCTKKTPFEWQSASIITANVGCKVLMELSANHVTTLRRQGLLVAVRTMRRLKGSVWVHTHRHTHTHAHVRLLWWNANISAVDFSYIVLTVENGT